MKPINDINKIISVVSEPSLIRMAKSRHVISTHSHQEPMTLLIHEGLLAAYRNSDQLLLRYFQAPIIVGINMLADMNDGIVYKAYSEVRYEIQPRAAVHQKIDKAGLWRETAYLFMFGVKRFAEAYQKSAGLSTYQLIRINLFALMEEEEELRLAINVSDYIQDKTRLSRSRVMKILSDLRDGEYIDIKRGILLKVNKLPENY
ncbi:helix-turn-helix domain-containing protein [Enterobacter quasiroggenkampii]|uniref:helix-turn-helix domain-containing protein n=1 Tax=Enterobacter quasiroggenkampii TaxID=2497436 RepID=UPI0021CFE8CA|nr:helix-turn-helix domain-containing protein [Enterobacter quasiroggenkampii]MCU6306636.1 helix-turn-helix domain-containing protein [Enterobacter quasiroggenkampii]MCU6398771.1 helix-turn-helix domain-containing protein [Enterobacter quasiroggenkampii]